MTSEQDQADAIMGQALLAAAEFNQFDQAATDRIVKAVFQAAFNARISLATMAIEETKLGILPHKVLKNVVASLLVYNDICDEKTVGVLAHDERLGITEIAQPLGPVFAITPVTNPTSTVIFKILICLKTRNPIIISPHRRAAACSGAAARLCYEAALAAGAPEDCVQFLAGGSRELTHAFMAHPSLALILATGGTGLVSAAYSSGTPAIGVGPGNVPVLIDRSADLPFAVTSIIASKTFDNGTVCASEQAVVLERAIHKEAMAEFERQHCYFASRAEITQIEAVAIDPKTGGMHADIVGQSALEIGRRAGLNLPPGTLIIMIPLDKVGADEPLSGEVLAPLLAFYVEEDYGAACKRCISLNYRGGVGHTAAIYANDDARIREFGELMNAGRVVVNTPSSQGGVGGLYNTLRTSFTLGCGSGGKNSTTENISACHLINIKKLCRRRPNAQWSAFDKSRFLDATLDASTLCALYSRDF
jgi:acetaldehyde dehydrogenase/alcohol dehydrogenase